MPFNKPIIEYCSNYVGMQCVCAYRNIHQTRKAKQVGKTMERDKSSA